MSPHSLATTDDPALLIPGDRTQIQSLIELLGGFTYDLAEATAIMGGTSIPDWKGDAADEFSNKFAQDAPRWNSAYTSFYNASTALDTFDEAIATARTRAQEAASTYAYGESLTATAQSEHDDAVRQARREDKDPELEVPAFYDPGETYRAQANTDLSNARAALQLSGSEAGMALRQAAQNAPASNGWDVFVDAFLNVVDLFAGFTAGAVNGAAAVVTGVWSLLGGDVLVATLFEGYDRGIEVADEKNAAWFSFFGTLATNPGQLVANFVGEYSTEWERNPGYAIGTGAFEVASIFLGGVGAVKTASRVRSAAGSISHAPKQALPVRVNGLPERVWNSFDKNNANSLNIGGTDRFPTADSNKLGSTKVYDTTDLAAAELKSEVFGLGEEISGGAPFHGVRGDPPSVWTAKLPDGTKINIRTESSSELGSSGAEARWTIDIINENMKEQGWTSKKLEMKFS